jgi:hypothetical protein
MGRLRSALVLLLCLPLIGCFDEPVREHLHLVFTAGGEIVVTAVQQVAETDRAQGNIELEDRMADARADLESGFDPWSRRFDLLDPLAEHISLERVDGEVRRSIHSAVLASFDEVARMLEADGLTGSLTASGATVDLQLFPTGGSRATSRQRDEAERRLREWSDQLAVYFEALIDLYDYLDGRSDRAVPCLAHIFDKHEGMGPTGPLTREEEDLAARVKEEMELVSEVLMVSEGEAYSLNELTRLVYDPFPAHLTVSVEGTVLTSENLIQRVDYLERPSVDAWRALISLEGRWVGPDLVTAAVAPASERRQPDPDPLIIAALPRHHFSPPSAAEVESAILSELVPADVHGIRWRRSVNTSDEESGYGVNWLQVMADAEASVPD